MIDPERLIKGMLGGGSFGGKRMKKMMKKGMKGGLGLGSGGSGIGFGTKAAIGMGVLGVALAATEHFLNKGGTGAAQTTTGYAPSATGTPAAPTFPAGAPPAASPPPPPPGMTPPPSPAMASAPRPPQVEDDPRQLEALLVIRSMIAAANADGMIDQQERSKILGQLDSMNVSAEERSLVGSELLSPLDAVTLASQASAEQAPTVYAAALLAIDLDTKIEQQFLDTLAEKLNLDPETRNAIHDQLDPQEGE